MKNRVCKWKMRVFHVQDPSTDENSRRCVGIRSVYVAFVMVFFCSSEQCIFSSMLISVRVQGFFSWYRQCIRRCAHLHFSMSRVPTATDLFSFWWWTKWKIGDGRQWAMCNVHILCNFNCYIFSHSRYLIALALRSNLTVSICTKCGPTRYCVLLATLSRKWVHIFYS